MKKLTNQFIRSILILSMLFSLSVTAFATEEPEDYSPPEVIGKLESKSAESIIRETYT